MGIGQRALFLPDCWPTACSAALLGPGGGLFNQKMGRTGLAQDKSPPHIYKHTVVYLTKGAGR